jgi:ATP-dependent Lon protease
MIPSVLKQFGIKKGDVVIPDTIVKHIITSISDEQGVRNLKRALIDIIGAINYSKIMGDDGYDFPYEVNKTYVDSLLKTKNKKDEHFLHSLYI